VATTVCPMRMEAAVSVARRRGWRGHRASACSCLRTSACSSSSWRLVGILRLIVSEFEFFHSYNRAMAETPLPGRILALDVGARKIGLAISDPLGITAQGLETLRRGNKRADLEYFETVIRKNDVREIVVGHPLRLSGSASAQTEKVEEIAEALRRRFQLPVHLWDERLTSAQAHRVLRESGISIRKRGQAVDRMAAVLILQSFLDSRQQSAVSGQH